MSTDEEVTVAERELDAILDSVKRQQKVSHKRSIFLVSVPILTMLLLFSIMSQAAAHFQQRLSETELDLRKAQAELANYENPIAKTDPPQASSSPLDEVEIGNNYKGFNLALENAIRSVTAMNVNNQALKDYLSAAKNLQESLMQREAFLGDDIGGSISVLGRSDMSDSEKTSKIQSNLERVWKRMESGKKDFTSLGDQINNAIKQQATSTKNSRQLNQTLKKLHNYQKTIE